VAIPMKRRNRSSAWCTGSLEEPLTDASRGSRTSNDGEGSPACPPPMSSGVDSEKSNIPRRRKPGSRGRPFDVRR